MRISDWSSDVCSSDLPFPGIPSLHRLRLRQRPILRPQRRLRRRAQNDARAIVARQFVDRCHAGTQQGHRDRLRLVEDDDASGQIMQLARLAGARGEQAFKELHRSEEHTSELQSLMRTSYAVLCLTKKTIPMHKTHEMFK